MDKKMTLKEYGIDLEKEIKKGKKWKLVITLEAERRWKGMKGIGIRRNMSKHNTSHHPRHFFLAPNIAYGCVYVRYNRNSCAVSYLLLHRATNVDLGMSRKRCRFVYRKSHDYYFFAVEFMTIFVKRNLIW